MNVAGSSDGVALTKEQRIDWLRLIRTENIGPRTFRALLDHYGNAKAALAALPDLARRGGASRIGHICGVEEAERELDAAHRAGVSFIGWSEPVYPLRLRMIDDPPPLIAVAGALAALASPMIAIVGSRNASAVGIKFTERLARELGEQGFVVVSGLARGIDAAAHRATLASGTVAVMAGGHERIYPPEHVSLAGSIREHGVVLSEMPIAWEPRAHDFPRRNRLISGLSIGVVIVEAAQRSGSLITARMALEQGREVFAVPGSPLDPRADGTNNLLKQGAILVTQAADVIDVIKPILGQPLHLSANEPEHEASDAGREPASDERARIVALLGPTPVEIDDLARLSGASVATIRVVLLELELAGKLERQAGGRIALL